MPAGGGPGGSTHVPGVGYTGKTKKKAKKREPKYPSAAEQREHQGKDPSQPLPPGPKVRSEREHRGEPVSPEERSDAKKRAKKARRVQRRVNRAVAESDLTTTEGSPVGDVLDSLEDAYKTTARDDPVGTYVRDALADEAKNVVEQAKKNLDKPGAGVTPYEAPTKEEVEALATIASVVPLKAGATLGEKALQKTVSRVSTASTVAKKAASAAKKAPKRKVARVKSAPRRAKQRIRETPKRIKTAPKRAKKAATTSEGRRAAAKGAGRKAYAHPLASTGALGAASNQAGADIPGLKQAGALVEGTLAADPVKSLKTTARSVPAIVTGPAALLESAGSSIIHGTPKPLEEEAKKQGEGLLEIGGKLLSGDPETVKKATEDEVGYSFVAPLPAVTRVAKTKPYKSVRGKARKAVKNVREPKRAKRREEIRAYQEGRGPKPKRKVKHGTVDRATGEEYILRRTGRLINNKRARVGTANRVPFWKAKGEREAGSASKEVIREVRKSKLSRGEHNIGDTLGTIATYGISRDYKKAQKQLDEIEASITAEKLAPDEISVNTINDLRNIRWLREHPEAFGDKHFWKAVDAYKRQSKEIETSSRKTDLALGDVYGVARPEERLEAGVTIPGKTETKHRTVTEPIPEADRLAAAKTLSRRDLKDRGGPRTIDLQRQERVGPFRVEQEGGEWVIRDEGTGELITKDNGERPYFAEGGEAHQMAAGLKARKGRTYSRTTTPKRKSPDKFLGRVPKERSRVIAEDVPLKVRSHFYKQPETRQRKEAELKDLERDLKLAEAGAQKGNPRDRSTYARVAEEIEKRQRELEDARVGYEQAVKDYGQEVGATRAEKGFEPSAYVKDTRPGGEVGVSSAYTARSAQSQKMADVAQSYRGQVFNRRFEDVVNESIANPRMKRAMHDATSEWVDEWGTPLDGQRYVTSDQIQRAVNRGELDPSQFEAFDAQHFKQAILDPHKSIEEAGLEVSSSLKGLKGEILERANEPGKKYLLVPKEAAREFVHQFEPPKGGMKVVGDANRLFTRVILGYSPAWALAQIVAEGIPAAVSIGTNPLRWARVAKYLAKENKRLDRKDKAAIDAMAGESPGVTPHPQIQFKQNTNTLASRFFRLSNRNRLGRALLKTASGEALSVFDRWKGGKYRKAVAAAKADREMNNFVTSLSGLMKGQRSIVEAIKGKSLDEQMAYIAKHPAEAAKLEGYLNNVMGNWRALTRHEAKFAPFIAFYPFVRYSLRWTFWSFPKEHPIKAQILYFLAQQNAEELEKLIGGPPANPVDYTFPVFTGFEGQENVSPGGQRFAPGMNALTTAIGKGRIETTATGLNPALGLLYTGISGVDPFTGEKTAESLGEHGLLALNQLLSLPAPLRASIPGVGRSARDVATEALGDEPPSDIAKAFREMDRGREARSFVNPLTPQSGARYRDSVRLAKALEESGYEPELGEDTVTQAVMAARKGDRSLVKELIRKRQSSDKAADEISRLVREYVADPEQLPEFSDKDWEVVNEITGKMVIPVETAKEKAKKEKEENPFGLPATDSDKLREEFGLPSTSASDLRKQFGIK